MVERKSGEKEEITNRISKLEAKEERRERETRKNNIIIKGVIWKEGELGKNVKDFLNENLEIEPEVIDVKRIKVDKGKEIILAKMSRWEEKKEVM